ncbi:lysozyme inhibitor LprI family protein [Pantoea sp. Ae16]|uniref:lysozyme inhibitor LprI family protein n=1 Tax=Pantoea sp. Ae16 TaxID=1890373 RepID=UPI0008FD42AD|nr:lysozyme inhibitor LprI family protein [Pantoea sp. Ae16]OIX90573.1 hypothetical protein BFS13_10355 [Pantoea sp. Ae16]
MKKRIVVLLMMLPAAGAFAAECDNAMTQTEMNQCAATAYKTADAALNQIYQQVLRRTDSEQKALLQAAQRRWIGFRDADCDFTTSSSRGGSIHPMLVSQCLQQKTEQRTKELQGLLHCEEGDLSCPL